MAKEKKKIKKNIFSDVLMTKETIYKISMIAKMAKVTKGLVISMLISYGLKHLDQKFRNLDRRNKKKYGAKDGKK